MKINIWCRFFNLHKYEIIKQEDLHDARGNIIGFVIVSRCINCGKIKHHKVYTEDGTRY